MFPWFLEDFIQCVWSYSPLYFRFHPTSLWNQFSVLYFNRWKPKDTWIWGLHYSMVILLKELILSHPVADNRPSARGRASFLPSFPCHEFYLSWAYRSLVHSFTISVTSLCNYSVESIKIQLRFSYMPPLALVTHLFWCHFWVLSGGKCDIDVHLNLSTSQSLILYTLTSCGSLC